MSEYDYGSDVELTEELHDALLAAESQPAAPTATGQATTTTPDHEIMDIEDLVQPSPFEEFKHGYLSVTDLVGTVWCEVQRPDKIVSKAGKEIVVDKVKVEDKDRILKRGQVIHERLEREFHVRIELVPETREDVWGLRFLNMLSVLESAIDLGTGRELPVVGFVNETMVLGVIDEIRLEPIKKDKVDSKVDETGPRQTSLTSFYSPSKSKPRPKQRTHRLKVSDSKTRASGTMPRDTDTVAGQLQLMLYKELLDAMLLPDSESAHQANVTMSFDRVFTYLALDPQQSFSDGFRAQSEPIITGNRLRGGAREARCLADMVAVWKQYIDLLGLGTASKGREGDGRTEASLELVYRKADKKKKSKRKRELSVATPTAIRTDPASDEIDADPELQIAIALSLQQPAESGSTEATQAATSFAHPPAPKTSTTEELEKEEDAIAWEVEMAYRTTGEIEHEGEPVVVHASQEVSAQSAVAEAPETTQSEMLEEETPAKKSGDIIGRHRFTHNPQLLARHLERVMGYWQGTRMPEGVGVTDTRRCGWCEFEEGCEWRLQKAQEALERVRLRKDKV